MNQVLRQKTFPSGQTIQLVQGDLTQETVDAIVNAANSYLQHGGGVAGVIARCGGPQIQQESNAWMQQHGPVSHAQPAYTRAGNLPCKYVIHAVGPIWGAGDEDAKLAAAIRGSLQLADALNLTSLALPAISTGVFRFPKARAARIILETIPQYFDVHPESGLGQVRLSLFDQSTVEIFLQVWDAG
ncbi:MAG TPA: macrodomain protein [Chloroflexi bacterium]|nr:macrodomain protein [Chloroflexota bacterium]